MPLHVTLTTRTPPSVSCQTIPSNVTEVPGSQGPKQSGSVIVPTDVPTQTSTISFGSHFIFLAGGGLLESSPADAANDMANVLLQVDNIDDADAAAAVDVDRLLAAVNEDVEIPGVEEVVVVMVVGVLAAALDEDKLLAVVEFEVFDVAPLMFGVLLVAFEVDRAGV